MRLSLQTAWWRGVLGDCPGLVSDPSLPENISK